MDRLPVHARSGHFQRIQNRLPLGNGNALVVYHKDPVLVVGGQHPRRLAGGGQAAGHGNIDHLVAALQHLLPQVGDVPRGGLGGGNVRILRQAAVERLLGQGDVLEEQLLVDIEGHGQHPDAQLLPCGLGDAAVAVGNNCYVCHINNNSSFA